MYQKEAITTRKGNVRAQITLFIIVGLLILFAFLLVIQLSGKVAKAKLLQEQEKVSSGVFRKEALRLYVEDCMERALENGLLLLGKQGTIWSDQPGGTKVYVEGITGLEQPSTHDRVAYGITNKEYVSHPEQYPCEEGRTAPAFCQYRYPNASVRFGVLTLADATEDLRQYLINQTYSCVNLFVEQSISRHALVEKQKLDLVLGIQNDGISVRASYPLKFSLSGEEFFQLSRFDFFYPTKFKQFFRSAIEFPFQQDYNFVDYSLSGGISADSFEYGSERDRSIFGMPPLCQPSLNHLLANTFVCTRTTFGPTYRDLRVELHQETPSDDTIFEFTVPSGIIKHQPYTFRMARQNRPPALDYVNRSQCLAPGGDLTKGYDYLVIKGDPELDGVDINLNAYDPDEDNTLTYSFHEAYQVLNPPPTVKRWNLAPVDAPPGKYTITVGVQDSYGSGDAQEVRILIDPELSTSISVESLYPDITAFDGSAYYVSKEDPALLKLTFPPPRVNGEVGNARLVTGDGTNWDTVTLPTRDALSGTVTYLLPSDPSRSDPTANPDPLAYYTRPDDITSFGNPGTFSVNPFTVPNTRLDLRLEYAVNYCGSADHVQSSTSTATVIVKDCLPHRSPDLSYPQNRDNAFMANHSCCLGNPQDPRTWRLATSGTVCYTNPQPGCYGKISEYGRPYGGYVVEQQLGVCDGLQGNTCASIQGEFLEGPLLCGDVGKPSCKTSGTGVEKIHANCYSQSAWGLVADTDGSGPQQGGWCYGVMGCTQFCSPTQGGAIVQVDDTFLHTPKDNELNTFAKQTFTQNVDGKLECGCRSQYVGKKCDADFNGEFEGACQLEGGTYKCKP